MKMKYTIMYTNTILLAIIARLPPRLYICISAHWVSAAIKCGWMWGHIAIVSPPLISWIICLPAPANRGPVLGQLGGAPPMRAESVGYNTGQWRHSDLMAATIITDEELTSTYRIRNYFNPLHSTISVFSLIHETYIVSNYCFSRQRHIISNLEIFSSWILQTMWP